MHQPLKTELSQLSIKRQRSNQRIQSLILKSISQQHQHRHSLTEQYSPQINTEPQTPQSKLLPVIARKGRIALPPPVKEEAPFGKKQPKISSLLHYQSQKLLQAARANDEERHLYKGVKKFHIQAVKLNQQSLQKLQRRGRYSLPSLIAKQLKMNGLIQQKLDNQSLQSKKQLLKQKQSKRKQFYLQLDEPQTITGWKSPQQQFDGLH